MKSMRKTPMRQTKKKVSEKKKPGRETSKKKKAEWSNIEWAWWLANIAAWYPWERAMIAPRLSSFLYQLAWGDLSLEERHSSCPL